MASWVGGLFAFATVFWRARPAGASGSPAARTALAIPAFSRIAVLAVGIVAVSGLILARFHLTSWSALVGTAYGRWLLGEDRRVRRDAGARRMAPDVAGASAHARARGEGDGAGGGPRVPAERPARGDARSRRARPGRRPGCDGAAGAAGAAATPGAAPAFRHERTFDEARVRLEVTPLRPGPNAIRLTVTDPAGRPLADATAAMVQVTPVDASVGAVTFQLDRAAPGRLRRAVRGAGPGGALERAPRRPADERLRRERPVRAGRGRGGGGRRAPRGPRGQRGPTAGARRARPPRHSLRPPHGRRAPCRSPS